MKTAKVIDCGRGQIVLLPEDAYINADEVNVTRHGDALVLRPAGIPSIDVDEAQGRVDELLDKVRRFRASFAITVGGEPRAVMEPHHDRGRKE